MGEIAGPIIILIALGGFLFVFGSAFFLFFKMLWLKATSPISYARTKILPSRIEQFLASNFTYYRNLPHAQRIKFVNRINQFIYNKEFIGRSGLTVTDNMKIFIAASAIQLTFGLEEYELDFIKKIFIYPTAFYRQKTDQYHKGEMNLGGAIALSWEDFQKGYSNPTDNLNLGLHEMAHALRFDKFRSADYDKFFAAYYDKWWVIAKEEFAKINEKKATFLREYAGSNEIEFFSVCVEYFFESPIEFNKQLPELYKHMCILLNQNPISTISPASGIKARKKQKIVFHSNEQLAVFSPHYTKVIFDLGLTSIFLAFAVVTSNQPKDIIWFIALLGVFVVIGYLTDWNKYIFYQNGFEVIYPFSIFNRRQEFLYEDIVSATMAKESGNSRLSITYVDGNRIETSSSAARLETKDLEKIYCIFKDNKVSIKQRIT